MSNNISFAKKVFIELLDHATVSLPKGDVDQIEGIVKSVNEFMGLLHQANDSYIKTFNIPDNKKLIFSEEMPSDLLQQINNESATTDINNNTLNDIRIVTYLAKEEPAIISTRTINSDGIRNIKWRFAGEFEDPEYTGYSIIRYRRDVEADITFKVWGRYFQDIRERASMLKDIIDTNTWFFKHKGLTDIVWLGSYEEEFWDAKNIAKFKTQKYLIRFSEIRELRQKNLEQIIVQLGLE